jgi:hypothetical protein
LAVALKQYDTKLQPTLARLIEKMESRETTRWTTPNDGDCRAIFEK